MLRMLRWTSYQMDMLKMFSLRGNTPLQPTTTILFTLYVDRFWANVFVKRLMSWFVAAYIHTMDEERKWPTQNLAYWKKIILRVYLIKYFFIRKLLPFLHKFVALHIRINQWTKRKSTCFIKFPQMSLSCRLALD